MKNYWKILLTRQREQGKSGFTLPFLIGSQSYLSSTHIKQEIGQLLLEMVKNDTFETCIRYCMDTNVLIFEIRNPENMVKFPQFKNTEQNQLSISISDEKLGETIEKVTESLMELYQDKIDAGLYSANRGIEDRETKWTAFSPSDEQFINECFSFNNDNVTPIKPFR